MSCGVAFGSQILSHDDFVSISISSLLIDIRFIYFPTFPTFHLSIK
jgi:hypothetical protein